MSRYATPSDGMGTAAAPAGAGAGGVIRCPVGAGSGANRRSLSLAIGADRRGKAAGAPTVGSKPVLNGQVPPELLEQVCGPDPSYICEELLKRTHSEALARSADVVFSKPLSILVIILVAWVVLRVLHGAIDRFVGSLAGQNQPSKRIKRTLRRTPIVSNTLPDSVLDTGTVSIRAAARAETLGYVLHSIASSQWATMHSLLRSNCSYLRQLQGRV